MGRASREKGKRGEREVVAELARVFGAERVRRGYQYRDGSEAPDVWCPLLHVESKLGKRPNLLAALEQAEGDARPGVIPIAWCRQDGRAATVTLRASDFIEILDLWLTETGDLRRAEVLVAERKKGAVL